ncbi:MAG: hypothetical protein LBT16_00265 [Treponema sp.]|nr:hypothetical protein [Treponema sp.]
MKTLTCDVCKRTIHDPQSDRNYYHLAHRELCENCKDELELQLKPIVRTRQPFNYEWYDQLLQDSIEQSILKGKIDVR